MTSISFVIPVFNEELNIEKTIRNLQISCKKIEIDYEIIIINDGSTDKTDFIISKLISLNSNIKYFAFEHNVGMGLAIKRGFEMINSEYFMVVPGDDNLNSANLDKLLMNVGKSDLILGFFTDDYLRGKNSRFISRLYSLIWTSVFEVYIQYIHSIGVYKTSILNEIKLRDNGFVIISELTTSAYKLAKTLIEIPLCYERIIPVGKSHNFNNILRALLFILINGYRIKNKENNHPSRIYL